MSPRTTAKTRLPRPPGRSVRAGHEESGLGGARRRDAEQRGQRGDRRRPRRRHLLDRKDFLGGRVTFAEGGDLTVGRVAAGVAQDKRVLTDLGQVHELVRLAAAHHARVGLHDDDGEPAAPEDAQVGVVDERVVAVEVLG